MPRTGWSPAIEQAVSRGPAAARLTAVASRAPMAPDLAPPESFTLLSFRRWALDQGDAGTCWIHAAVQMMQVATAVDVEVGGEPFEIARLSRRFGAYYGKVADGTNGNPDDGGSIKAGLVAMSDDPEYGKGVCHESLWPYPEGDAARMRAELARRPPQEAAADARLNRCSMIADVPVTLGTPAMQLVANGHPIGIGIWWPVAWDTMKATAFSGTGSYGSYGHAITIIGYARFQGKLWWHLDNWHGPIYKPLPDAIGRAIPGYKPAPTNRYGFDGVNDFWVEDRCLRSVLAMPYGMAVSAAGIAGFVARPVLRSFAEVL